MDLDTATPSDSASIPPGLHHTSDAEQLGESRICFGPFCLLPTRRLLMQDDRPLPLGSRALDILTALVEQSGALVTKDQLMARVWPNTTVVEDNLTVQIAALRRALRDGEGNNRYIVTVPGRGYCFVASVTHGDKAQHGQADDSMNSGNSHGRDETQAEMDHEMRRTLNVPTRVTEASIASILVNALLPCFDGGVCIIDLAEIENGTDFRIAVLKALAACTNPSKVSKPRERMLLVLDNCQHLVPHAATIV